MENKEKVELTIWVNKKTGLERRLNRKTVEKLGKALTNQYYQVENPMRPTDNPPEVTALLQRAQKVNCCNDESCKKDCVAEYEQPQPVVVATDEQPAAYVPAVKPKPKHKGGRPRHK
jgi:hypothetical protein